MSSLQDYFHLYRHPRPRVNPSARNISNREADRADHAELRLKTSSTGMQADVVVIDCPNRHGGPLTLSVLNAVDTVVYAATATSDGIDGVDGARCTVAQFRRHSQQPGPRTPSPRPASSSAG